jgi:RNA polymerase-binding transcription factor
MRADRQYRPSDKEPFMNERQREYFREKLVSWRQDVLNEAKRPLQPLRTELNQSDIIDRASSEADRALELRARERQRKLISKIDAALARLDEGTYGFCEETGEPIALAAWRRKSIGPSFITCEGRAQSGTRNIKAASKTSRIAHGSVDPQVATP